MSGAARSAVIFLAAAGATWAAAGLARAQESSTPGDRAVQAAGRFLLGRIGKDGASAGEAPPGDPRFGGKTALCVHALLTAGVSPAKEPALSRAIEWLAGAELNGTYAVAMRACAMSQLRDAQSLKLLAKDTAWLIRAMGPDGSYTYTSLDGEASGVHDNSNAQMALLGVWSGASRDVNVPPAFWARAERYWLGEQQPDGGWGYRVNPRTLLAKTYGSMTAAGLASLYICFDNLRQDQFVRCHASTEYEPITKALGWLSGNFHPAENPAKGVEWYYYWLYCLARVGLASGHKYFGTHDWYAEALAELLAAQNGDGSWGYGDAVAETSFAMVFIVRGRYPVLLNKLHYRGKWSPRPRDAANLIRWLSFTFERPVAWQIVDANSPLEHWHEAPILYISGAGAIEFTPPQVQRLRIFALQGGLILSEAACNNGDFTLDVRKLHQRIFPDYPLTRLSADHPIYSAHAQGKAGEWLSGVDNGVRLLAVHAPREISLAMQIGPREPQMPIFDLLANVYLYATDRGTLRPRGQRYWPEAAEIKPRATIRLARLAHGGNCDPEPLAFQRLAILLANRHGVRLEATEPMKIADLDAARWPVAHMTGTLGFTLSDEEAAALKKYFQAGGTLLIDAAGGSTDFASAVRTQIPPLLGGERWSELALDHPLYAEGPYDVRKVRYRRDYALALREGPERTRPRLRVLLSGDRLAAVFSPEDLTAGLLGYPGYKLAGYEPQFAEQIMTNALFHASGVRGEKRAGLRDSRD